MYVCVSYKDIYKIYSINFTYNPKIRQNKRTNSLLWPTLNNLEWISGRLRPL